MSWHCGRSFCIFRKVFGDTLIECRKDALFAFFLSLLKYFNFFLSQRNIGACYALYVERVLDFQCLDLKIMFAGRKLREHASFFAFFDLRTFLFLRFSFCEYWLTALFYRQREEFLLLLFSVSPGRPLEEVFLIGR